MELSQIAFIVIFIFFNALFFYNAKKIYRNINLGKANPPVDNKKERFKLMLKVAFGQSKMKAKPTAFILHLAVYVGFIIVNLDVMEMVIDGFTGKYRIFSTFLPRGLYSFMTATYEVFAMLVILAAVAFFIRRNFMNIRRFVSKDLNGFPRLDANIILVVEVLLMLSLFMMDGADYLLAQAGEHPRVGFFPISEVFFVPLMQGFSVNQLEYVADFSWWIHMVGVLLFLNYLVISKHLHIILAFPNVYLSKLLPKGELDDMHAVTREVKLMLDPMAEVPPVDANAKHETLGAKDVFDLHKTLLLNAYTCTQCGRCSSACPANLTGKELSPREIMMKTRLRLAEVGANIDKNKTYKDDGKDLFTYITKEELWACTTCNACTQACPVNIDPIAIIIEMRRYLIMEKSEAPQGWNIMMANIENNGAPWPFGQQDRMKWAE